MLKLKHGSKFVNRAGSAWRLMFVYALFPWLSKYRIHSPEEEKKTDREIDLTSEFHILRSDFSMAKNEDTVAELKDKVAMLESQLRRSLKKKVLVD